MSEIEYKKSLIGEEDLLLGFGIVNQTRGNSTLPINKINSDTIPYSNDVSIKTILDSNVFTIDSLEDFNIVPNAFKTVIVKDLNRGGVFVSKTDIEIDPNTGEQYEANGVTVFAGNVGFWARQYNGAVGNANIGDGTAATFTSTYIKDNLRIVVQGNNTYSKGACFLITSNWQSTNANTSGAYLFYAAVMPSGLVIGSSLAFGSTSGFTSAPTIATDGTLSIPLAQYYIGSITRIDMNGERA